MMKHPASPLLPVPRLRPLAPLALGMVLSFGALAGVPYGIGVAISPALAQGCLSAGETRQAIANGQILQLAQIRSIVAARGYREISSASVCFLQGRLLYSVVATGAQGASARILLDAASGTIVSEQ